MPDYPRLDPNGLLYYSQQLKQKIDASVPPDMTGATAQANGAHGLVPQPNAGQEEQFLKGSGAWGTPPNATQSSNGYMSSTDKTKLDGIEEGAQENVIEGISVNGVDVTPDANKKVAITIPDAPVQSISVNTTPITPDSQGNVDITVPIATSDLTNDSDFQTGTEVQEAIDAAVGRTYKPGGSKTFATLPTLSATYLGYVYNVTDAFTTTSDFVEGAGKSYPAGSDVGIVDIGTTDTPLYKYNVMSGFVDLSGYVQSSEMTTISNATIDTIIATAFNPNPGT